MEHIADINFKEFFKDYFIPGSEFDDFYNNLSRNDIAPKMMHQTARIISLADKLGDYIAHRPAINLMFYIMTAELVAKLFYEFEEEGKSKEFVKKFFIDFCSKENKDKLCNSIKKNDIRLNLDEVIEFLYKIRCDVVHEGNYYKYSFNNNYDDDDDDNFSRNALLPEYKVNITIEDVRKIIIETSINSITLKIER